MTLRFKLMEFVWHAEMVFPTCKLTACLFYEFPPTGNSKVSHQVAVPIATAQKWGTKNDGKICRDL